MASSSCARAPGSVFESFGRDSRRRKQRVASPSSTLASGGPRRRHVAVAAADVVYPSSSSPSPSSLAIVDLYTHVRFRRERPRLGWLPTAILRSPPILLLFHQHTNLRRHLASSCYSREIGGEIAFLHGGRDEALRGKGATGRYSRSNAAAATMCRCSSHANAPNKYHSTPSGPMMHRRLTPHRSNTHTHTHAQRPAATLAICFCLTNAFAFSIFAAPL